MDETIIRQQICSLLKEGHAHMTLADAVKDFPASDMNTIFPNGTYSFWHLLEHIRRTQHDILDFMINPHYVEMEWPKDYWPLEDEEATPEVWENTLKQYFDELEQLNNMAMDPHMDLTEKVPQGTGQTYFREFLLVADHTSYHVGELAIMRQTLNNWPK